MVQELHNVERSATVRCSKMAETAFSEDGKYFSAISQDGRLGIWDTETNILKQEYTPDLHLSSPPSCLQWISVTLFASPLKGQKKDRKSISDQETQCIAIGTTSGKILIYSVAEAKVETVLEEKSNEIQRSGVTSLDWHEKYGLYTVNKENVVHQWNLQNSTVRNKYNVNIDKSKQANISAIKIVPHNQKTTARYLVTASTQIRIWRLQANDAELVKCLGHNTSPKALLTIANLNNTCWLVEGSQNERLLSFWDVTITSDLVPQMNGEDTTPNRKKRKKSTGSPITVPTPTYNFVLEDAPKQIDVNVRTEDNGTMLSLAAVTRSGVVHYYGHLLNGASTKPIKPSVTVHVTTAAASPLPLLCCRLARADLLLGYSQGSAVIFETITPDLKSKTQVLIRSDAKDGKKQKQAKKQNDTNKVRGETSVGDVTYVEPLGGVARKRVTPGSTVEAPMEARLANLSVGAKASAAVGQNLTRLLAQALHSKDSKLILTVLQHDDPKVAQHTVGALPAQHVPQLLEQLADMATRKTSQCACVCTWALATLRAHSALLLAALGSNSDTARHLTRLLAIFTSRRSHLCQLLNLKGRLELAAAQRHERSDDVPTQPVLEYNDSSSDEEMEVERPPSESEQSWNDSERDHSADMSADSDGDST